MRIKFQCLKNADFGVGKLGGASSFPSTNALALADEGDFVDTNENADWVGLDTSIDAVIATVNSDCSRKLISALHEQVSSGILGAICLSACPLQKFETFPKNFYMATQRQ